MSKHTRMRSNRQATFLFDEDSPSTPEVLGGKGAGLAELARIDDVPVPAGFTVSTTVARAYAQHKRLPQRLFGQLQRNIAQVENETGKGFCATRNPLLLSVRSGAAVSMPGMMDTVLNLGLNRVTVHGLAAVGGARFAFDCYRRFLSVFGEVVLGVEGSQFKQLLDEMKARCGVQDDHKLEADALVELCHQFRCQIEAATGSAVVEDPWEQLQLSLVAVLKSWDSERAQQYRKLHNIADIGTAVNVQSMVFGNLNDKSGTGVVFSRNVATGEPGMWGEFLANAQGEDVVSGSRTPLPISELLKWNPAIYAQLDGIVSRLEKRRRKVVDVEYTIEDGKLYILQVRSAKMTPEATVTSATHFVWEGVLTKDEAVKRVSAEHLKDVQKRGFQPDALKVAIDTRLLGRGLAASPGVAIGRIVYSSEEAVAAAAQGEKVVLFRPDTSPKDLKGMMAAEAIITEVGGTTSHAAVVARELGKPAVVSCKLTKLPTQSVVSVDGHAGVVLDGAVELAHLTRKKEINLFLKWVTIEASKRWSAPRLVFDMVRTSVPVGLLVNDFYLADRMCSEAKGTALEAEALQLRTQVHTRVAERVAMYLVVAVGGELRHLLPDARVAKEAKALLETFSIQIDGQPVPAQMQAVAKLSTLAAPEHLEFVTLAEQVFRFGRWYSAYHGGPKWAEIAQAAVLFLSGKLSHSVFADHAFDLEHNTGSVFGKHVMIDAVDFHARYAVKRQLEAKKHADGVLDLHRRLSAHCGNWSREVDALYRRGLAVWKQTPVAPTPPQVHNAFWS